MATIKIQVKGLKELNAELVRAENSVNIPLLRQLLFNAVDLIRQEAVTIVRAVSRRSDKIRPGWEHIEDALIAQAGKSTTYANAFAKLSNKLAPQGRWLEFGHRIVGHRPDKVDTGKLTSPRPFFRPAVDAKRAEVRRMINDGIKALLEGRSPISSTSTGASQGKYTDPSGEFIN
jgi:hypothetical protein